MTGREPLSRTFFARSPVAVARDLLGCYLVHETQEERLVGRIVEAEAYRGPRDPASHAYRRTPRSAIMWGRPATAYVYFTYGHHYCMNAVTEREGVAGAVLLRALEPIEGIEAMAERRGTTDVRLLASGPGRLTQAMKIGREQNGVDLTSGTLYVARGSRRGLRVKSGPRIGINTATDRPWRFYLAGHPCVSR